MDIVLDILDELVLDRVYAAALPLNVFLPKAVANITSSSVAQPSPSLWTSVASLLPHPPVSQAADAAAKAAALPSSLPSWLLKLGSPVVTASAWPRDYIPRQLVSLTVVTLIGIHVLYFLSATLSYYLIFDHNMMKHPRFLKANSFWLTCHRLADFHRPEPSKVRDPMCTVGVPGDDTSYTSVVFVRGYSRLYEDPAEYGYAYLFLSVPFFVVFTDYLVYWIHRILHHPLLYKRLHKPHHKWLIPTPFASYAFHPVDGYAQSLPYHIFIFLFPLHRWVYLGSFVAVIFWTIFIHDSDMITGNTFVNIINGPAHHTLHHLYFTCNYGQYFTWADRWGGSYKHPSAEFDPMNDIKAVDAAAERLKTE